MASFEWVDILAVVFALGLAALGAWRGLVREVLVTLAGIVLGVVLGQQWAATWGGADPQTEGIIRLASLVFIVLFLGYGVTLFLRRRTLKWWQRLFGGIIGMFNGILLVSFVFQDIQEHFVRTDSVLGRSITYAIATDYLSWAFVVVVVAVALAVAAIGLVRFGRFVMRLTQPPEEEVLPPAPVAAPPLEPALSPEPAAAEAAEAGPITGKPASAEVAEPTVPCPNCGQPVPFGAAYCPQCGKIIS